VLQRFHRAAQEHGADAVRVVATSALRDARNGATFLEWARAATGWRVEVISGLDEARLIHLGILSSGMRLPASPVLLMDLGGGSCELTVSRKGHIKETVSLPIGAVRLTREFLRHDPPKRYEVERMRGFIAEEVARVTGKIASAHIKLMLATSGTAAALATHLALTKGKDRGRIVRQKDVVKLAAKLARLDQQERERLPGIGPNRAQIIIAGATVFAELMQRCSLRSYRYSPLGLRDGVLAEMAASYDVSTKSRKQIESDRWDALLAAGRRYDLDMEHALQVRALTMRLFRELRSVHRLPPDYAEWLSAAAMLHEVGNYVNRAGRHRHAHYIIAHSEIFGYTKAQRQVIAAIARYLGKSRPSNGDAALKPLNASDRALVPKAVALIRLAAALNQGRRKAISGLRARAKNGRVVLKLAHRPQTGADLEVWALEKERGYFREVFGRELAAKLS
jgi:exopolyphosphatase/guanosine-5'-triphosphate,3'-diphosphate pyrophosphatase